jgi:hypothetical protein
MTEEVLREFYETAHTLGHTLLRPVAVDSICDNLGIRITRSATNRNGVKRAFLLQANNGTQIVLPETSNKSNRFTAWERFLIAHELGHYFLSKLQIAKPLGPKEYWQIEKVCDTFARRLLLPANEVAAIVSIANSSAAELLGATLHLHVNWAVPWAVAAHEVSECTRTVYFFNVVAGERRFRISLSTLPDKRRIGRIIEEESSLGRLLQELPHHGNKPRVITNLKSLQALSADVADAAICRAGTTMYRVAAVVGDSTNCA